MSKYQKILAMIIRMAQTQTPEQFQATISAYADLLTGIPECYHDDALLGAADTWLGGENDAE